MAQKVELYSQKSFTVYKELSFKDQSLDIEKAKVVNTTELIRVLPTWGNHKVKIKKGAHSYDADVLSWPTVRSFIKSGMIKVISADYDKEFGVQKQTKTAKTPTKGQSLESLVPDEN